MNNSSDDPAVAHCVDYARRLSDLACSFDWRPVAQLAEELRRCSSEDKQVFLAGNGGSAGNAVHLANDFLGAVTSCKGTGIRVHALPANVSVLTCLANDVGYESIFSLQLGVLARAGDVLVVFSGSGNSPNILSVLETAKSIGVRTYAVLGYSGGKAKALADVPIHFPVNDMQISEDMQLIVGHMIMQWLMHDLKASK